MSDHATNGGTPSATTGSALVVGASRGLGLLIAGQLLERGYHVVIAARDEDALRRARDLLGSPDRTASYVCDVTDRAAVAAMVQWCEDRAPLDVVITVAGIIQVGPAELMTLDQFDRAIATMTVGPINVAWTALPAMRARGRGRIGTVTSVGGMVGAPHMLPYVAAKFGAVGFSDGLAAELAGTGVTATTIVPGLMRTGSPEQAMFMGNAPAEFAWFGTAASLPLVSMDADRAAARIVSAVLRGAPIVVLTPMAWLAIRVRGLLPGTTTRLMGVVKRLLPKATGVPGEETRGSEARPRLKSPLVEALTVFGRRAAARYNER